MNQNNKRSQICEMHFLPISNAQVENIPGSNSIKVHGEWIDFHITSGEFKEKQDIPGGIVDQELKVVITDTNEKNAASICDMIIHEGLVLIEMTNGNRKVIGTDQFPVTLSPEYSGSPIKLTLLIKRDSPESAKILKSF